MLDQVLAPLLKGDKVLLGIRIVQRLSRRHIWSTPMHLERPRRRHNNRRVRLQPARPALDIAELLHTHVSTEAALGENIADTLGAVALLRTRELERDPVGDDGRVPVGDVREGASVDEDGGTLKSLHQVGLDRILHEDSKGSRDANVVSSDRIAALARGDDHRTKPLLHVLEVGGQREDGHNFTGDGDVEAGGTREALLGSGLADGDLAQVTVVGVEDTVPGDGIEVDVQASEAVDLLGGEVVGVGLVDPELLEALEHQRSKLTLALLRGYQALVQLL